MLKAIFAFLAVAAVSALGGDERGIWEAPVLAQPFEHAPFRPVRIPEWVRGTLGVGYTLSGMDSVQRERAVAAGVTMSEFGFVDPFYAYYDSKLLARRSPHVPLERLDKDMAEYQRLGVKILGVYPPCLQGEVYETHPEWRRIATNTREIPTIDMKKFPHGGMLCLLGPYGDFFIEVLAEIVTKYPAVAAFSFDGLHYGGVCYCENCRVNFRKETGGEIPNVSMEDPAFRRYQHWADRRMESLVQRMQTRLKGINPDITFFPGAGIDKFTVLDDDDLFEWIFNVSNEADTTRPDATTAGTSTGPTLTNCTVTDGVNPTGNCAIANLIDPLKLNAQQVTCAALNALAANASGLYYVTDSSAGSPCTLPGRLGAPDTPAIVVVNEDARLNGTILFGMLFVRSNAKNATLKGNGQAQVYGSVVVEGSADITGGLRLVYDDTAASSPGKKLPESTRMGRVPGSWLDSTRGGF